MDIDARLEKLERENRRMKKVGIVGIVFASVLFFSGQAKTNKVVEANEFRLLDASGKERATLHVFRGQPELFIRSLNGESDVLLGTDTSGPYLIMGPVTGKATVTLNPNNLSLEGPVGKLRLALNHEAGGPNMTIEDNEGYSTCSRKVRPSSNKDRKKGADASGITRVFRQRQERAVVGSLIQRGLASFFFAHI